jgi:hypothetical protein
MVIKAKKIDPPSWLHLNLKKKKKNLPYPSQMARLNKVIKWGEIKNTFLLIQNRGYKVLIDYIY